LPNTPGKGADSLFGGHLLLQETTGGHLLLQETTSNERLSKVNQMTSQNNTTPSVQTSPFISVVTLRPKVKSTLSKY